MKLDEYTKRQAVLALDKLWLDAVDRACCEPTEQVKTVRQAEADAINRCKVAILCMQDTLEV